MTSPRPLFDTQLYQVTLPHSFKSTLINSATFTPRSIPPNSIDYLAPDALEQAFNSLPLPSDDFYSAIEPSLQEPAQLLRDDQTVAFPTETVYGLGANACSTDAVMKIYQAKGRPSDNPLIVHVATQQQLVNLTHPPVNPLAIALIHHFWPGPLSIILPHNESVSPKVTAGLQTLAIRMPNHPIALALIKQSNCPIAAPSSNTSGKPSPTLADHVINDLQGKIPAVVDGLVKLSNSPLSPQPTSPSALELDQLVDLNCFFGLESTVVDISHIPSNFDFAAIFPRSPSPSSPQQPPQAALQPSPTALVKQPLIYILRPGAITKTMLESIVGEGYVEYDPSLLINMDSFTEDVEIDDTDQIAQYSLPKVSQHSFGATIDPSHTQIDTKRHDLQPKSPGMKYTHYAPKAPVYIARKLDTLLANILSSLRLLKTQQSNQVQAETTTNAVKLGLLCTTESYNMILQELERRKLDEGVEIDLSQIIVKTCGSKENMSTIATNLYRCLREFDQEEHVGLIYAELLSHNDLGAAVMDRLLKAAGGKFLR